MRTFYIIVCFITLGLLIYLPTNINVLWGRILCWIFAVVFAIAAVYGEMKINECRDKKKGE